MWEILPEAILDPFLHRCGGQEVDPVAWQVITLAENVSNDFSVTLGKVGEWRRPTVAFSSYNVEACLSPDLCQRNDIGIASIAIALDQKSRLESVRPKLIGEMFEFRPHQGDVDNVITPHHAAG
ncbi:MAG: hypothetical protein HQ582_27810 [Planctomycetes bacterium]|nr:hypothetical protein [Planctomycetota bacterium]